MEYQDFTIDIRSSSRKGRFEATVVDAAIRDTPRVIFSRPIESKTLQSVHRAFDRSTKTGTPAGAPEQTLLSARFIRELGQKLFAAVLHDELLDLLHRCRAALPRKGSHGLRLRLKFRLDDPEAEYLAALPWEWLCDPESGELLATDLATPVVRDLATPHRQSALEVKGPLRILVVDAAPQSMKQLDLKLEIDRMSEALQQLTDGGRVELLRLSPASPEALRDALRDESIHILHFMGHAGYHAGSGMGALFFVAPDGSEDQVDGEMLASYLKTIPTLRLVVLNACNTARHAGRLGAPFNHGVASALLERAGVPAVVANQHSISDPAAVAFSQAFYGRIARGDAVDAAITEGRLRLSRRGMEWATPVLFLSARDGKLFAVASTMQRRRTAPAAAQTRTAESALRLGVRSIVGWGADMEQRNDAALDLVPYFDERFIRQREWWQDRVFPELRTFLRRARDPLRPLLLDFAAHSSIAFAAGWLLDAKSGLDVGVRQRTMGEGEFEWRPKEGAVPDGSLWLERPDIDLAAGDPDVAVALSVSQPGVAAQVRAYLRRKSLPVGRIVDAAIAPVPGARSVHSGAHALQLAQALVSRLRVRHAHEREGALHLFCAAPNALVFYLGQLSRSLGNIFLYEYPFGAKGSYGRYQRSIELPPPGEEPHPRDWQEW